MNMNREESTLKIFYDYVRNNFPDYDLIDNILISLEKKKFNKEFAEDNGRDIRDIVTLLISYRKKEYLEIDRRKMILIVAFLLYLVEPKKLLMENNIRSVSEDPYFAASLLDTLYSKIDDSIKDYWYFRFSGGYIFDDKELSFELKERENIFEDDDRLTNDDKILKNQLWIDKESNNNEMSDIMKSFLEDDKDEIIEDIGDNISDTSIKSKDDFVLSQEWL